MDETVGNHPHVPEQRAPEELKPDVAGVQEQSGNPRSGAAVDGYTNVEDDWTGGGLQSSKQFSQEVLNPQGPSGHLTQAPNGRFGVGAQTSSKTATAKPMNYAAVAGEAKKVSDGLKEEAGGNRGTRFFQTLRNIFKSNPKGSIENMSTGGKTLDSLKNRLRNIQEPGMWFWHRGRLSDDKLESLLRNREVVKEVGSPFYQAHEGSRLKLLMPEGLGAPIGSVTTVLETSINETNLGDGKTVAMTYTFPGRFENHIVTIYAKDRQLVYFDPKGNPPPGVMREQLNQLARKKSLTYQENDVAYQQDTMNCGSYSAAILDQLHQGKDPVLGVGPAWIEAVKQQWANELP